MAGSSGPGEPPGFADAVLACVRAIPAGRVMSYGDVAEYAGIRSPRSVGQVLASSADVRGDDDGVDDDGTGLPWHRVLRADGSLAPHIRDEQRQRLLAEGVGFRGDRVDLTRFRWDGRPSGRDGQSTSAE